MAFSILRGSRVLDIAAGTAEPADILVEDDAIQENGPPGPGRCGGDCRGAPAAAPGSRQRPHPWPR
jgi:hypothetical protein